MRTLSNFIRSLANRPYGSPADGRRIGIGLDAALRAQRARGAEAAPLTTRTRSAAGDRPYTAA